LRASSTIKHGAFASIRLTDPEKGYERQGRYFSKLFGTQWLEYWEFLDDFADLSSESGLELLEQYLNSDNAKLRLPSVTTPNGQKNASTDRSKRRRSTVNNSHPATPTGTISMFAQLDEANTVPPTPVSRAKCSVQSVNRIAPDPWREHRSVETNLLNDSLDESSDNSELQNSLQEPDSTPELIDISATPRRHSFSPLRPIVGLLEKLTFRSPLRWLLVDRLGCGEPLFAIKNPTTSFLNESFSEAKSNGTSSSKKSRPKRRMSAANLGHPICDPEQPAAKKPSPVKSALVESEPTPPKLPLPTLFRHVCRALPGGDPELETAVAVMACVGKETKGSSSSPNTDCLAPRWFRSISLSKYHTVSSWKRYVEECDTHLSHPTN
uniref:Cauli_VI domain-containing protein n=1 Tax=Echinostoma caproni TaxID=27848 RepID=A0A183B5S0_9TREM